MRVLSIDIGSRNLGACVLESGEDPLGAGDLVRHWRVFELSLPISPAVLCDALTEILKEWTFDSVVIERQPGKSHLMQRLQHYCEMLFHCQGSTVAVMEARNKLIFAANTAWWPPGISTDKWTYRARKTAAVKTARAFLQATSQEENLKFFEQSTKRDDLADSLLQAMAHAHMFSALDADKGPDPSHKQRKPTPRQLQKGKLNAAHICYVLKDAGAKTPDDVRALAEAHPAFKGVLATRFANDPVQMLKRFALLEG